MTKCPHNNRAGSRRESGWICCEYHADGGLPTVPCIHKKAAPIAEVERERQLAHELLVGR